MLNLIVAVGVALALGGGSNPVQAQPVVEADEYFGINISGLVFGFPQETWGRHLDAIARSGIRVARVDAPWNAAEPRPPTRGVHRYDWRRSDALVVQLARRGLRWLPIVDYSARWAATDPRNLRSAPRDIDSYAAYAGALAARYGPGGSFWRQHSELEPVPVGSYEIWNAPNYVATAFPAERYADAYLAARERIRAADPNARVIIGGLSRQASHFLRAILDARPDARGNIDAVGLHPYAARFTGVVATVAELRAGMDDLGMADVPIAITEVGWATQGSSGVPHASDRQRAKWYALLTDYLARSDCGVDTFVPHTWVTLERDPAESEHWFGIQHPDGNPSATARAYSNAIRRLRDRLPVRADVPLCSRTASLRIRSRSKRATARRSDGRSASRRRTPRRLLCHEARVTLGSSPLSGVAVRFRYADRRGRTTRTRRRTTNEHGVASVCFRRRSTHQVGSLRLRATRPDLATPTQRKVRARLP